MGALCSKIIRYTAIIGCSVILWARPGIAQETCTQVSNLSVTVDLNGEFTISWQWSGTDPETQFEVLFWDPASDWKVLTILDVGKRGVILKSTRPLSCPFVEKFAVQVHQGEEQCSKLETEAIEFPGTEPLEASCDQEGFDVGNGFVFVGAIDGDNSVVDDGSNNAVCDGSNNTVCAGTDPDKGCSIQPSPGDSIGMLVFLMFLCRNRRSQPVIIQR